MATVSQFSGSGSRDPRLPVIEHDDTFRQVLRKLALFFEQVIELPSTFEQLRTTVAGNVLRVLVDHLAKTCTNPATVNALLALKWHYASSDGQLQGVSQARSNACEIVAWRLLACFTEQGAVEFCLYELPPTRDVRRPATPSNRRFDDEPDERAPLIERAGDRYQNGLHVPVPPGSSGKRSQLLSSLSRLTRSNEPLSGDDPTFDDPTVAFEGLNALEIAAIANAKRFLSQPVVQKIITGIWNGDIVFWDALSRDATKRPRFYDPATADPFSRLRVPKYMKCYEVLFFLTFLCLYYAVLVRGATDHVTPTELVLLCWLAAFAYDEFSEWLDAGSVFYTTDVWNLFDVVMVLIGVVFAVLRIIALIGHNSHLNGWAFDILALEALFMIPRIFSFLSLSPYWGTLVPCLKEMGKDFLKFMVLVIIFYLGFLTTFSLLGRAVFTVPKMIGILTRIFFGSGYLGLDIMHDIDPVFGPPLMLIFIIFTNILLLGSLTGILSNSFMRVTNHAREEYLYVYAVFILEASTSNRLTHFFPPFNLLALVIFRPWALLFPRSPAVRTGRIALLKITHLPIVAVIKGYEMFRGPHSGWHPFDAETTQQQKGRKSQAQTQLSTAPAGPSAAAAYQQRAAGREDTGDQSQTQVDELDGGADDSGVQAQIGELHRKIDLLTDTLLALQAKLDTSDVKHTQTGGT